MSDSGSVVLDRPNPAITRTARVGHEPAPGPDGRVETPFVIAGRLPAHMYSSDAAASRAVAHEIAGLIRARAARGQNAVLGLATGSTPQGVYDELVRLHREDKLSFANVLTFNLDEYWPMDADGLQSYRRFMREHLFDLIDIAPDHIHIPDGRIARDDVGLFCADYERRIAAAGGIDFQLLGVGRTGHIGFNEPGSPRDSRTRMITLDRVTRQDAAADFFGEWNVPRKAVTMGVGTILAARRICLLAFGEHKAGIIRRAVEGEVTASVAASFLQEHGNTTIILDPAAAAELTRVKTPWRVGPVAEAGLRWDDRLTRRAVVWLARTVNKPILKLTDEDYNESGLQELLSARGGAYDINIEVFKTIQNTITGWPGGKAGRARPDGSPDPVPKRIVVFSPHPDDDVISMGGTFIRLCEQGHDVHVAYQTSGNIAVFDDEAVRYVDFVREFLDEFGPGPAEGAAREIERGVSAFLRAKRPGQPDTIELQRIKAIVRRTEARAGARYSGVRQENIHFLDLPFYETGRVKKKPLGENDIRLVCELLETVQPHQIYAAGDLSDPHGTHRVCLRAITRAIEQMSERPWIQRCDVWLYRGAWQEWEPHEIEMAVPLSPDEVQRKRLAIFKHQSQKDRALFPGPNDSREFWQRAEERNRATAEVYDKLGLPEYQAIEGFVRWRGTL